MPLGSGKEVPSLRAVAQSVLRPLFHTVDDVGDAGFDLVKDLLALATAPQLHRIEARSPHLIPDTEGLWKELAIKDFVQVRIAVEDDTFEEEPKSWRALHQAETIKQEERMEAVLQRMRGAYKSHSDDRATIGKVDGVMMAKRRKLNSMVSGTSRPKSLMEKARVNSKRIQTIYAPRRRPGIPVPTLPAAPAPSAPSSSNSKSSASPRKPPPKIHTITRTVRVPAPPSSASSSTSARSTATASTSKTSPPPPFSPPIIPAHRAVAPLPHRRPLAASPPPSLSAPPPRPPSHALSPPPPPTAGPRPSPAPGDRTIRPSAKALSSVFLLPKRKR
ncbi:RNA polymerase II transcription factor SIII subunit A-domain-containing protein [Leucosporidium creatinivorum]|uniref:RNA polymerase II transcription factor SIII subunit A-domain-containing protein n=1 Tax=Leucosporidium creatinivorum TaxID=106004 RepID=A0A1Y2F3I4_9BASI|nr:RNA polymerase II transcription factor SIII subunit A-domain-containing protein [Leucosporidium creatinivorum]